MSDEVRKRAACDRCHSQKTKCPRTPGQNSCDRCLKAKTTCVFRPFRQKKLPEESREDGVEVVATCEIDLAGKYREEPSSRSVVVKRKRLMADSQIPLVDCATNIVLEDPSLDFEADWMNQTFVLPEQGQNDINIMSFDDQDPFMSFDFCTGSASNDFESATTEPCSLSHLGFMKGTSGLLTSTLSSLSPSTSSSSNSLYYTWGFPPQPTPTYTLVSCIKALSQLSIDLYEHSQTIPSLSIHDPISPYNTDTLITPHGFHNYAVDDVFRLTQAMIEVYPRFLAVLTRQRDATQIPRWGGIDHSAILLILSCHLRLIGIYEELFKHMDICMNLNGQAITAQQKLLTTPQLKIGCYTPPASSVMPMRMLQLIQFATQLFQSASTLAAEIQEAAIPASTDSLGDSATESGSAGSQDATLMLTRAAAENVKDRAGSMSRHIHAMTIMTDAEISA